MRAGGLLGAPCCHRSFSLPSIAALVSLVCVLSVGHSGPLLLPPNTTVAMALTQDPSADYARWPRAQDANGRVYLYHGTDRVWLWRRVSAGTAGADGSAAGSSYLHNVITNEVKWPQQLSLADARDAGVAPTKPVASLLPAATSRDPSRPVGQVVNAEMGAWAARVGAAVAGGSVVPATEGKKPSTRGRSRFADAAAAQLVAAPASTLDAVSSSLQAASSAIERAKGSISFHAVFPSSAVPSIFPAALVAYARRSLGVARATAIRPLSATGPIPTRASAERAVWREVLHLASQAHRDRSLHTTAWAHLPPATGANFGAAAALSPHANVNAIADVLSGGADGNGMLRGAVATASAASPYPVYQAPATAANGWGAWNGALPQDVAAVDAPASGDVAAQYAYSVHDAPVATQLAQRVLGHNKRKLANSRTLPPAKRTAARYWGNGGDGDEVSPPGGGGVNGTGTLFSASPRGPVTDARATLNAKRYGDKTRFGGRAGSAASALVNLRTAAAAQPAVVAATSSRVRRLMDLTDQYVGTAAAVRFTREYALVPPNQTSVFDADGGDDERSVAARGPVLIGRNMTVEKDFLRLTAEADASLVRPEAVLRQALTLVQQRYSAGDTDYAWVCRQLKSIRQDLLVQAIENDLTEAACLTHARVALENSDVGEFNQCLTRLVELAAARRRPLSPELSGYRLLYAAYSGSALAVASLLAEMSPATRGSGPVLHARRVWRALTNRNAAAFFGLYEDSPGMNASLMDLFAGALRADVLRSWVAAYRPSLPLPEVVARLGWRYTHSGEDDQLVAMARSYITDRGGQVEDDKDRVGPAQVVCGRGVIITPDDTAARITCMAAGQGGL